VGQEQARHGIDGDQHDRKYDSSCASAGRRSDEPAAMVERFIALLWGDLLVRLLLGVRDAPTAAEIEARARAATDALLRLPARAGD
jgi:hypothetical protein